MKRFLSDDIAGLQTRPGRGRKPIMGCSDEQTVHAAIEQDRQSVSKVKAAWQEATGKEVSNLTFKRFFIHLGARYKRIRKRTREVFSPQLYDYKHEKLQELEQREREESIALYYADENHIYTEGYAPYGWQLPDEDVCIPFQRIGRLNIFEMIDLKNHYEGFTTTESITADKIICFLDIFPLRVRKDIFVVFDNVTVHRNYKICELRFLREKKAFSFSICLPIPRI